MRRVRRWLALKLDARLHEPSIGACAASIREQTFVQCRYLDPSVNDVLRQMEKNR